MCGDGVDAEPDNPSSAPLGSGATRSDPSAGSSRGDRLHEVCVGVVSTAGVDGAGITVMGSLASGLEGARDQIAATGFLSGRLEELQLTVGEGPCLDAYATGVPVLVSDLASGFTPWLAFAPEALAAGAAAVFSLPLQVGAVRVGTLDLYRYRPGGLSREQLASALAAGEAATGLLLEDSRPEAGTREEVEWLSSVHADVHVASGVVAVQTDVDVGTALVRLRGYAFAHGMPLHDVARRVIDRALLLTDDSDIQP